MGGRGSSLQTYQSVLTLYASIFICTRRPISLPVHLEQSPLFYAPPRCVVSRMMRLSILCIHSRTADPNGMRHFIHHRLYTALYSFPNSPHKSTVTLPCPISHQMNPPPTLCHPHYSTALYLQQPLKLHRPSIFIFPPISSLFHTLLFVQPHPPTSVLNGTIHITPTPQPIYHTQPHIPAYYSAPLFISSSNLTAPTP